MAHTFRFDEDSEEPRKAAKRDKAFRQARRQMRATPAQGAGTADGE